MRTLPLTNAAPVLPTQDLRLGTYPAARAIAALCGPSTVLAAALPKTPDASSAGFTVPGVFRAHALLKPIDVSLTRLSPETARTFLFNNVAAPGTHPGSVIASPSRANPNYFYHWTRDAALVMAEVLALRRSSTGDEKSRYDGILRDYVNFTRHNQLVKTPSGNAERASSGKDVINLSDLGEPKFEVDGAPFTGDWGRPQDDGPALRAITLINYANDLLDENTPEGVAFVKRFIYQPKLPAHSAIKADLEHVANRWQGTSFDLWEEERAHHFYTRLNQRRALVAGAKLARRLDDPWAAAWYEAQIPKLEKEIERHWDQRTGLIRASRDRDGGIDWKTSGLDVCVLLASLHAAGDDWYFAASDPKVLATAQKLIVVFRELYPINRDELPGTAIGRYPEDRFDPAAPNASGSGNPWILATLALGEIYFRAKTEFITSGVMRVTKDNETFFNFALNESGGSVRLNSGDTLTTADPRFAAVLNALQSCGDAQIARVYYHANVDGSLSEQIDRNNGFMHGAQHLTWNYAAFLSVLRWKNAAAAQSRPA